MYMVMIGGIVFKEVKKIVASKICSGSLRVFSKFY